ncbi:DUF4116 domain-containing protein [Candidatus Protochlamydia phocaeensis]|uniref:DUF4116 domain-containing protein n=1 Tax=Candidatus Protochlamydia phocaeensis TaxID=1414722 RepID=UPI0008396E2C|nr:DUF4116 domain-containing protein [Candidatus Protochlamydia phocaeensis]
MNSSSAITYISPALFTIIKQGSIEQEKAFTSPVISEDNQFLPNEVLTHIFNFYKRMTASQQPFLLTSKQWYVIAMSDPFIRLAQAVFRINRAADVKGEFRINCSDMWPSSPMTVHEFHQLLKLDKQKICLERIFHFNEQLFSQPFQGYFYPLLHVVRWDPNQFLKSEDIEVQTCALNHLAFYELMKSPVEQWQKSLTDGTINWDALYGGASNPSDPQSPPLSQSAAKNLEALMATLSSSKEDRPHILNILQLHGLAIRKAPPKIQADLEAALIAVEQNPLAFDHVDPSLHIYRNLVLTAVRQNGRAYNKLTNHLRYDIEVLAIALNQDLTILDNGSPLEEYTISFYSLRQLAKDLSQITINNIEDEEFDIYGEPREDSLLPKCLHAIALLPHIQNIENKDLRQQAIIQYAHRWSRMAVRCLNKLLPMYQKKAGCPLELILSNLSSCLLTNNFTGFKSDLKNAIFGKFLHGVNEKGVLEELTSDPETVTAEQLQIHFKRLLIFFMESVELDPSSPECSKILGILDDLNPSASKEDVLRQMEEIFLHLEHILSGTLTQAMISKETKPSSQEDWAAWKAALKGPLKLWPLLRAFNRLFIIDLHARLIMLNRLLGDQEKIVAEYRNFPDHKTKSLSFIVKDSEIVIQVKRLGHLLNYENCSIQSEVLMRASAQDLSNWDMNVRVNIMRPTEGNEQFEKAYNKLLTLLDFLEMPYEEFYPY